VSVSKTHGLVFILLVATSGRIAAAEPAAEQTNVTSAAIPAARIAEGIEACRERLSDIEQLLANDPRAEAVQNGLPDAEQQLAKLSKHSWSVITSQSPTGFRVWIRERGSDFTIGFEGWHEEFTDADAAFKCFAFGLSTACRLRVFRCLGTDFKWQVLVRVDGNPGDVHPAALKME
jgi:hypothetical protein